MSCAPPRPPRLAAWLLGRCISSDLRSQVLGDFEEIYGETYASHGPWRARLWYCTEIAKSAPALLFDSAYWWFALARSQLLVGIRQLRRQKTYSVINILGLSVGIASCLLVLLFVRYERSYDSHFVNAERIYRVTMDRNGPSEEIRTAATPRPLAATLLSTFPDVEASTRISRERTEQVLVRSDDQSYFEERFAFADSNFFDFFGRHLILGDPDRSLALPRSVVLTEETAKRYFGTADPIGKTIAVRLRGDGTWFDYTITGITRAMPDQTHFHFDFLASYEMHPFAFNRDGSERRDWTGFDVYTYLRLKATSDGEAFEQKLPLIVSEYLMPAVADRTAQSSTATDVEYKFHLQPIAGIHLRSGLQNEFEPVGNDEIVRLLSIVAGFILLIACVNFVNLSTARASRRAREVGIRKVVGSYRRQLMGQFLLESVLLAMLAFVVALLLTEAVLPSFNQLTGKSIPSTIDASVGTASLLLVLSVLTGLLAGVYPAMLLSSFQPVRVLRGSIFLLSVNQRRTRSGLVLFQFCVATALIVSTAVLFKQMKYIGRKDVGFEREHVVVINETHTLGNQIESFTQSLNLLPGVLSAGAAESVPGRVLGESAYVVETPDGYSKATLSRLYAGFDFVETLGLDLVAGRSLLADFADDSTAALVNRSAVAAFGLNNPIGKQLIREDGELRYNIIGVLEDFNFTSLRREIGPLVILGPDPFFENRPRQIVAVRVRTDDLSDTVDRMAALWTGFAPDQPFRYSFLDDEFDELYRSERQAESLLGLFCSMAIFIACLGLFGLASYEADRRQKEITVRKALGASTSRITVMLIKDLVRPVTLAFFLAAPISFFASRKWLDGFAYRTDASWEIFLVTGAVLATVTLLSVGAHALRAASTDPVSGLRTQ